MGHLIDRLLNEWRLIALGIFAVVMIAANMALAGCTPTDIRSAGEVQLLGCRALIEQHPERTDRVAETCRRVVMAGVLVGRNSD